MARPARIDFPARAVFHSHNEQHGHDTWSNVIRTTGLHSIGKAASKVPELRRESAVRMSPTAA